MLLFFIGITAFIICGWGIYGWGRSIWIKKMVNTMIVNTGVIKDSIQVEAVVFYEEELIFSNHFGVLQLDVKEGQRVRKDEAMGRIVNPGLSSPRKENILLVPQTGVVSFVIDGMEGIFTPEKWGNLDFCQLNLPEKINMLDYNHHWVDKDVPVARIINNLSNTFLGLDFKLNQLSDEQIEELSEEGNKFNVQISDNKEIVELSIVSVQKDAERIRVLGKLSNFREDLIYQRKIPVEVIVQHFSGLVVPREALVYQEGSPGLYVLYKGCVQWKAIEINEELHDKVIVEGLSEGAEVIINPQRVNHQTRIY